MHLLVHAGAAIVVLLLMLTVACRVLGSRAPIRLLVWPMQDALLLKQTPGSFRAVLGAKAGGLLRLERPLSLAPASATLLFSSVSSLVAPLGQPNYAAANATLNAWANAQSEQARPLPWKTQPCAAPHCPLHMASACTLHECLRACMTPECWCMCQWRVHVVRMHACMHDTSAPVLPLLCAGACPPRACSVASGAGTGMAVTHNLLPRIMKSGLGVLPPARGVAALASVLARACSGGVAAQLVVVAL